MRRLWSLVALMLALLAACSTPPTEGVAPAPPTTAETTTTPAPTTTTTGPVPADVADLAATTTMTERARRIFLAASPAIEDPATFAAACGTDNVPEAPGTPRTHTQGCYVRGRIHLLATDQAEARGLLYVVAAHELLHAAYAALSAPDRTRIDAELQAAQVGNERLEERLKPYGTGPTLTNEVHSILGSEFDGLSPALEAHYAQFFADRAAIVSVRQRTLGSREDEIRSLKADIDDLDARITTLKDAQEVLRDDGDFRGYNANVVVINGLITRYDSRVDALNARIDEYNGLLGG